MKKFLSPIVNVPRFFVLLADFLVVCLSFALSYFILKQFKFPMILRGHFFIYTFLYSLCAVIVFYLMRIHSGVMRYSTISDMFRIFTAILISSVLYFIIDQTILFKGYDMHSLSAYRVLLINFFVSSSTLMMMRVGVRGFYTYIKTSHGLSKEKVIIYGADSGSILIKQALESGEDSRFTIVGFISDRYNSRYLNIQQKRVFSHKHISLLRNKYKVEKLVLTNTDLTGQYKQLVIEKCLEVGIKILTVPPSDQWIYGRLKLKQIQDLKIEDLLHRAPIKISDVNIFKELSGKRILVTGAAGSIGSEIVRQVAKYRPEMIILIDQAESQLYDMQLEIEHNFPNVPLKIFIASIRNYRRMKVVFEQYLPNIIFHAAAYKHVPMMEHHATEAILTNVLGTKNIADLAVRFGVGKFVMISTDKAVNPTNIMGASKRIAEIYIQSLNDSDKNENTKFLTTRFGNVLDSNGSVIPRFRSQIQSGGPLTVTHPEIVRYFMTIPEAVQLVLEAGATGQGGEIFIFDMGKPVKIYDLALNMIKLAGLVLNKDIHIEITGLRPGEKLFEELLNVKETSLETHHEKIKIAKVIKYPFQLIAKEVNTLMQLSSNGACYLMVKKMKEMVPEFISQNSIFEELDLPSHDHQLKS